MDTICKYENGTPKVARNAFKVAPYSFTIAHVLMTKAQVISARSKEKNQCFFDFYDVNMSTKSKTDSKFSCVSFGECFKIWRSCNHIPLL